MLSTMALCNNCGKYGHQYSQCKKPIISMGAILFRITPANERQYLLICRKNTLGYIDFIRGKYTVQNKDYIVNMIKQMTDTEKTRLLTLDFDTLWQEMWEIPASYSLFKTEEYAARLSFNTLVAGVENTYAVREGEHTERYDLAALVQESNAFPRWDLPEWGFPKGRRNCNENDFSCALRETMEETGYEYGSVVNIKNIVPFEEIFIGSNYKTYKHKYYLLFMPYETTLNTDNFQKNEVSCIKWCSLADCLTHIRSYNQEKLRIIKNVDATVAAFVKC